MVKHLRVGHVEPVILRESQHLSIRLFPLGVVAKVVRTEDRETAKPLAQEIDVARFLSRNDAPVVAPSSELPAGPHVRGDLVLTPWEFVEHVAADENSAAHVVAAAAALGRVHRALAEDLPFEASPKFGALSAAVRPLRVEKRQIRVDGALARWEDLRFLASQNLSNEIAAMAYAARDLPD